MSLSDADCIELGKYSICLVLLTRIVSVMDLKKATLEILRSETELLNTSHKTRVHAVIKVFSIGQLSNKVQWCIHRRLTYSWNFLKPHRNFEKKCSRYSQIEFFVPKIFF